MLRPLGPTQGDHCKVTGTQRLRREIADGPVYEYKYISCSLFTQPRRYDWFSLKYRLSSASQAQIERCDVISRIQSSTNRKNLKVSEVRRNQQPQKDHMAASDVSLRDLEAARTTPNSHTSLQTAKKNLSFLIHPDSTHAPNKRRTRALLRSLRYIGIFIFWRLYRYAKYAAVGALTAAIAGTAIGSVASGAAFIIAPTGILGGAGVGLLWGMGKFGWRILGKRLRTGEAHTADARNDENAEHSKEEAIRPPSIDPW